MLISIDDVSKEAYINNINADTVKCGETILNNQEFYLFRITIEQYNYFITVYNKLKDINPLVKELLFIIFRKDKYEFMCSVFNLIYNKLILLLKLKREYLDGSNVYILDI